MLLKKEDVSKKDRFIRLKNLMSQSGWADLIAILEGNYRRYMDILKDGNATVNEMYMARGAIKCIDEFVSELNSDIGFGKKAYDKFIKHNSTIGDGE